LDRMVPLPGFSGFLGAFRRGRGPADKCPNCGTTAKDVETTGMAGCPLCYEALPDGVWKEFGVTKGSWAGSPGW